MKEFVKSKRILFITNRLSGGGSERVLTTIANELSKNNNVSILSIHKGEMYAISNNIKILTLSSEKNKIDRILKIRKIIKRIKPNIIISFEYHINMQVCIANIGIKNKLIISERNDPNVKGNNYKHIRNALYRFADVLVCQTNDAKNYFPKSIQKKSVIILNPLKKDLPVPWKGEREKVIVNFCRLEKQKNIELLINAFEIVQEKYKDYKLHIFGEGEEKNNLLKIIKNKKLEKKVYIYPFDNNIHEKIRKYSLFVSSSDYEGLSNSMLEAMAIGLPVICTDCPCGGARMVIKNNENGILVPVGDIDSMSNSIIEVLSNKEKREYLSKNASLIKEKISSDKIIEKWLEII